MDMDALGPENFMKSDLTGEEKDAPDLIMEGLFSSNDFGLFSSNWSGSSGGNDGVKDFPNCEEVSPLSASDYLGEGRGLFLPSGHNVSYQFDHYNNQYNNGLNDSGLSSAGADSTQNWDSPKSSASVSTPGNNNTNQFDFSFSISDTSSVLGAGQGRRGSNDNESNASADSPTRTMTHRALANFPNQWDSGDVSSLLVSQNTRPYYPLSFNMSYILIRH